MTSPLLGLKNTQKVQSRGTPGTSPLTDPKIEGEETKERRREAAATTVKVEAVNGFLPSCASLLHRASVFLQINLNYPPSCAASEFLVQPDVQELTPQSY